MDVSFKIIDLSGVYIRLISYTCMEVSKLQMMNVGKCIVYSIFALGP